MRNLDMVSPYVLDNQMESVLREIIEYTGRKVTLRRVSIAWRNAIDINSYEVLESLYHKYDSGKTLHVHDLISRAAMADDIHLISKIMNLYMLYLPVDWNIIAYNSSMRMREVIRPLIPMSLHGDIMQYISGCNDILQDKGVSQEHIDIMKRDDVGEYLQIKTRRWRIHGRSVAAMLDTPNIFSYEHMRNPYSLNIAYARGSILRDISKDKNYAAYMIDSSLASNIPAHYRVLSAIIENIEDTRMRYDAIAIAISEGFQSLGDKYITEENAIDIMCNTYIGAGLPLLRKILCAKNLCAAKYITHKPYTISYDTRLMDKAIEYGNISLVKRFNAHQKHPSSYISEIYDATLKHVTQEITGRQDNRSTKRVSCIMIQNRDMLDDVYHRYLLYRLYNLQQLL